MSITATVPLNQKVDTIAFVNTATRTGVLNGPLILCHDHSHRNLRVIELHWGRNAQEKLAVHSKIAEYSSLNTGTKEAPVYTYQRPLFHRFDNTVIPDGASHLLVWVTDTTQSQRLYASRPLKSEVHLLPPNASRLERQLSLTGDRLNQLPVLIDSLWDPSRCPQALLPWLAWATSGDTWFSNANDPVEESIRRRNLIRKSAFIHQHKGTRASVQNALERSFAYISITLTEWWQQTPRGLPHTFHLEFLVNASTPGAGTAALNNKLHQVIDAVKPVRSHYSFSLSLVQTGYMRLAVSSKAVSYKRFNMAASL